jgi:hypothetical protein
VAGIQWLGDIPRETSGGYIAKALGEGVSGYFKGRIYGEEKVEEKRRWEEEKGLKETEIDLKKKKLEHDYAKLDYDKRKEAYDSMVKLLPSVPPDKQMELTSSPEWTELEKSLGLPSLSGSTLSPEEPKPSWGQTQETESIKADLARGRGSISTLVGEPLDFQIKDLDTALDYISKKGRNPAEFAASLEKYKTGATAAPAAKGGKQKSPYPEYPDAYLDKGVWKVKRGGKVYRIEE